MTQETIDKLPLVLSASDLRNLGFSQPIIYQWIFKAKDAGVVKIGGKLMVQRDEFFKWLEKQTLKEDKQEMQPNKAQKPVANKPKRTRR